MPRKVTWGAYRNGELVDTRKRDADIPYGAVLYDPATKACALWAGSVELAEKEQRYAAKNGRKLELLTDVRVLEP